jgi:FkbM family methyltransferase
MVTYDHDLEWAQWAIAHIHKNLSGFRKIVAVTPEKDRHLFEKIPGVEWQHIPDWEGRGYYWQQWVKIQAWKYTDAPLIVHIDSDTMVDRPCKVSDFLDDRDRPYWAIDPYTALGDDVPWKRLTESAVGLPCVFEYMRRFPFVLWRHTHEMTEQYLVDNHQCSLEFLLRNSIGFSEFNVMGRLAHEEQEHSYTWLSSIDLPKKAKGINQRWSHTPFNEVEPQLIQSYGDVIPIITDFGVWVIPGDTHLSKWIREHRRLDFDTPFLEEICKHIPSGGVVADVGAFVGDHSLAYAMMTAGDPGAVYAFEPNPVVYECLKRNMAPYLHVHCIEAGLGACSSLASISKDPNFGGVYLNKEPGPIKVMTLDSMRLERLDLMKIDAEGLEVQILIGSRETLERCRPVLVIEVNAGALERQGTSPEELLARLDKMGYEITGDMLGLQYDIFCTPKS